MSLMNLPETTRETALKRYGTLVLFIALLLPGLWLRYDRTVFDTLPGGDEPSWMSVAAELARGNGFTTRWYEHPFLEPRELPRPDDYRFPGLAVLLALAFKVFGIGTQVARSTVVLTSCIAHILLFLLALKTFGRLTALLTLLFSSISLLQIEWTSVVYSEALFSAAMYGIFLAGVSLDFRRPGYWLIIGVLFGLAYYVRPNIMVTWPAPVLLGLYRLKKGEIPPVFLLLLVTPLLLIPLPWWIRNAVCFGNPLHVASGGGFFVYDYIDRFQPSPGAYLSKYGPGHVLMRPVAGAFDFVRLSVKFEHGLILPYFLLWIPSAFRYRRSRGMPLLLLTTAAHLPFAFWVAHRDWSGPRYVLFAFPLLYMFGIKTVLDIFTGFFSFRRRRLVAVALLAATTLPIVNPHRYYYRRHHVYRRPGPVQTAGVVAFLRRNLGGHEAYFGLGDGKEFGFLTNRNSVSFPIVREDSLFVSLVNDLNITLLVTRPGKEKHLENLLQGVRRRYGTSYELCLSYHDAWWRVYRIIEKPSNSCRTSGRYSRVCHAR